MQRLVVAVSAEGRQRLVEGLLLRGAQGEGCAVMVVVADLHQVTQIVELEERPARHQMDATVMIEVLEGMGVDGLEKSDAALEELRSKGLAGRAG